MPTPNTQSDLNNSQPTVEKVETNMELTPAKVESPVVKKNNSPLIIGGVVGALLLTAIVAGVSMNNKPADSTALARNDKSVSAKNNSQVKSEVKNTSEKTNPNSVMANSSTMVNNQNSSATGNNSSNQTSIASTNNNSMSTTTQSTAPNQTPNTTQSTAKTSNNPAETTLPKNNAPENKPKPLNDAEAKVKDERSAIDKFLEVKATNEKINLNPLTMTKDEAKLIKGDDKVSLEVKPDPEKTQKFRYTVDYASAGDEDFEKATLTINVDKALKIIPGSVKDNFNGQSLAVSDSVFSGNVAKYGPGSKDKEFSGIKVGQKGSITIDIEVPKGTAPGDYRIASILDNLVTGKTASNPNVFFFEVK